MSENLQHPIDKNAANTLNKCEYSRAWFGIYVYKLTYQQRVAVYGRQRCVLN